MKKCVLVCVCVCRKCMVMSTSSVKAKAISEEKKRQKQQVDGEQARERRWHDRRDQNSGKKKRKRFGFVFNFEWVLAKCPTQLVCRGKVRREKGLLDQDPVSSERWNHWSTISRLFEFCTDQARREERTNAWQRVRDEMIQNHDRVRQVQAKQFRTRPWSCFVCICVCVCSFALHLIAFRLLCEYADVFELRVRFDEKTEPKKRNCFQFVWLPLCSFARSWLCS